MDRGRGLAYMCRMDIVTKLFTWMHGRPVGTDSLGNRYFTERKERATGRTRRWVVYKGYADASIKEASTLDLLLIPGGIGTRTLVRENRFIDLLSEKACEARLVASVCTGSALLAKTGLLDGHRATSNKIAFDWVCEQGPSVHWVREARWVEDGKFFTSSGISAGIDMTLGVISHLYGWESALEVARRAEYLWNEESSIDPFA